MQLHEIKTKQDVFDFVVMHLATQGQPAKRDDGVNAFYSSDRTKKCAIGCLIPDEKYDPDFEKLIETERLAAAIAANVREACQIEEPPFIYSVLYEAMIDPCVWLPNMLRLAHDMAKNADELKRLLQFVAITHRLSAKSAKQIVRWEC